MRERDQEDAKNKKISYILRPGRVIDVSNLSALCLQSAQVGVSITNKFGEEEIQYYLNAAGANLRKKSDQ